MKLKRRTFAQREKHRKYWIKRGYELWIASWVDLEKPPRENFPNITNPPRYHVNKISWLHVGWVRARNHYDMFYEQT